MFKTFTQYITDSLNKGNKRSVEAKKNIIISLCTKVATVLASLLLVPMTINYVNPTRYGIWLTLSSTIGWITFFDLGLGNGFRNRFAEAKAKGDILLARQYLSTTYFAVGTIVLFVNIIILFANSFLNWTSILNIDESYQNELQKIFYILATITCVTMVANIFSSLLMADQKPGYASIITAVGQYLSLLAIYLLTLFTTGSLMNLTVFFAGIPCLTLICASICMFCKTHLKIYSPSYRFVKLSLVKDLIQFGLQFFLIYLCLIAIFQIVNIVISREIGPVGVTQYNIANKYFNIIYMVILIIITPYWSAFTDAYTQEDYIWMKSTVKKLEKILLVFCGIGLIMLIVSPVFYDIWIGNKVVMPFSLSIAMLFLVICQSYANTYMYIINGIGTIRIQLITYVIFAVVSWPLFTYLGREIGLIGIMGFPSIVYIAQGILGKIQISKLLNKTAKGIWVK